MLQRKLLVRFLVTAIVLTIGGIASSKKPNVSGPVQEMLYDESTDVLLGMPKGAPPLTSFQGALQHGAATAADLGSYPPSPCAGIAAVWNGILADPSMHGHAYRESLIIVLQTMATNQCAVQIVRDESTSPATIVSIQPIPVGNL